VLLAAALFPELQAQWPQKEEGSFSSLYLALS